MNNIPSRAGGSKQPPWRAHSREGKILLGVRAVLQSARPLAVTLNLSPTVAERAASDLDWLRRRVVRHLRCALGRDPALVMVYDVTKTKERMHLHAALAALHDTEIEQIRLALSKAGGEWDNKCGKDHQVCIKAIEDEGWATYIAPKVRRWRENSVGWSMTNPLRTQAKKLHQKEQKPTAENAAPEKSKKVNISFPENSPSFSTKPCTAGISTPITTPTAKTRSFSTTLLGIRSAARNQE